MNDFQQHIGVGTHLDAIIRTAPTRERKVIAEEGPRKGRLAAIQTDHKSGRLDARVFTDTEHTKARIPLCRTHRTRALRDPMFLASIPRPSSTAEIGHWLTTHACVVCGDACEIDPHNRKDVA